MFGKNDCYLCDTPDVNIEHIIKNCNLWDNVRLSYFPSNWNNLTIKDLLHLKGASFGIKMIVKWYFEKYFI